MSSPMPALSLLSSAFRRIDSRVFSGSPATTHTTLALALALAAACGGNSEPFTPAALQVVGPPALVAGNCPTASEATYGPLSFENGTPSTVRLTYLEPGPSNEDADARLLCDVVVDYGAPPPIIAFPGEEPVDLAIEFFAANGALMASGVARNVDFNGDLNGDIPLAVRATPVGAFTCAADHMGMPRAFHSAAPLPDGRVVITGGATAAPGSPNQLDVDLNSGLYLTNAVELFDPETREFTQLSVPGLVPRAMHTSSAWTDGSDIFVALVGGFTVPDPSTPAIVPNRDGLRWAPAIDAAGTATEVLVLSPDGSVARLEGSGDVPAVMSGHSAVVDDLQVHAGGQQWVTNPMTLEDELLGIDVFTATDTVNWVEDVPATPLLQPRRGATVTQLGAGRALVWGGHMEADAFQMLPFTGEILSGLDGNTPPTAEMITYADASPIPRALHQAVRLGDDVLIIGGFDITNGTARMTALDLIERLTLTTPQGTEIDIQPVTTANGVAPTPAAYLGVTHLASGDVLINGGNPQSGHNGCNTVQDGITCSIDDAYLYRLGATNLEQMSSRLVHSRYGHQSVEMADGQVLITGGLYAPTPNPLLEVVGAAELLDLRAIDADVLSPGLTRAPADVARTPDGEPRAACVVIENGAPAE